MSWSTVEAQDLEEGNEILLSPNTGETGIVEDVHPARWSGPGRSGQTHVVVTLCDGREFTLRRGFPACLVSRDANGWPKSWRERMRTSLCPACGKSGVTVGLDCTLLETSPTVRPHACGVGGPGAGQ